MRPQEGATGQRPGCDLDATIRERLRRHCEIPDEYRILAGIAIGYTDPDFAANHLDIPRNPISKNITFLDQ